MCIERFFVPAVVSLKTLSILTLCPSKFYYVCIYSNWKPCQSMLHVSGDLHNGLSYYSIISRVYHTQDPTCVNSGFGQSLVLRKWLLLAISTLSTNCPYVNKYSLLGLLLQEEIQPRMRVGMYVIMCLWIWWYGIFLPCSHEFDNPLYGELESK